MKQLITVAVFSNTFDIKYSLFKDMLDQAKIPYLVVNENARSLKQFPMGPSNISIEIKVYEEYLEEAVKIIQSIQ